MSLQTHKKDINLDRNCYSVSLFIYNTSKKCVWISLVGENGENIYIYPYKIRLFFFFGLFFLSVQYLGILMNP